jgi:molybdenum cofactor guanylyltransferase
MVTRAYFYPIMTGVILCGGQSTRMGTDKGLIPCSEGIWARAAVDKMATLHLPVVISINPAQHDHYLPFFPPTALIMDDRSLSLPGPLLALLSVHRRMPAEDLLVLACDMPMIRPLQLQTLLAGYRQDGSFDAYVYSNEGQFEPMCGLYTAKGLSTLLAAHLKGALQRFSMKAALNGINTMSIPIPDEQKYYFQNINSRADLEKLITKSS